MGCLADTHALLWWLADAPALPAAARGLMADPEQTVHCSAASVWEIGIKRALGKLEAPDGLAQMLAEEGFEPLPILGEDGEAAAALPPLHRDPFDRVLIAQAQRLNLTIITANRDIARYDVRTAWG